MTSNEYQKNLKEKSSQGEQMKKIDMNSPLLMILLIILVFLIGVLVGANYERAANNQFEYDLSNPGIEKTWDFENENF